MIILNKIYIHCFESKFFEEFTEVYFALNNKSCAKKMTKINNRPGQANRIEPYL